MINYNNRYLIVFIFAFTVFAIGVYYAGKNLSPNNYNIEELEELKFIEPGKWTYIIDFTNSSYKYSHQEISSKESYSGEYSSKTSLKTGFSSSIDLPILTNDSSEIKSVYVRLRVKPTTNVINASLVFSVFDDSNNQIYWSGAEIFKEDLNNSNWYQFSKKFEMPGRYVNKRNYARIYLWNHNQNKVLFVDDFYISFQKTKFVN